MQSPPKTPSGDPPPARDDSLAADLSADRRFEGLPGWELVATGLADLAAGRESDEAFLVAMATARLAERGITVAVTLPANPEERLYRRLEEALGDAAAHSRYNALRRRLTSFLRSSAHAPRG